MTNASVALIENLRKMGLELDQDFLQQGLQLLTQWFIEQEVTQQIGAAKHERTPTRQTQRNGYPTRGHNSRERTWETRVGELDLRIPKLRHACSFPQRSPSARRRRRQPPSVPWRKPTGLILCVNPCPHSLDRTPRRDSQRNGCRSNSHPVLLRARINSGVTSRGKSHEPDRYLTYTWNQ